MSARETGAWRATLTAYAEIDAQNASTVESAAFSGDALDPDAIRDLVLNSLEEDKAENIIEIDLRGKTAIADYMVIVSGRSSRHVSTIAEKLVERLKARGAGTPRMEGAEQGDWVLIDANDVLVHVFRPEVREFYNLEKMWLTPSDSAPAN